MFGLMGISAILGLSDSKSVPETVAKTLNPIGYKVAMAVKEDVSKNGMNSKTVKAAKTAAKVCSPIDYALAKAVKNDVEKNGKDGVAFKMARFACPILNFLA